MAKTSQLYAYRKEFEKPVVPNDKKKATFVSNTEWLEQKAQAQQRFEEDRNNYFRRNNVSLYADERRKWLEARDEARILSEVHRRQRLNTQILEHVEKRTVSYGADHERLQFTRKERDILVAIFTLACLSTDLYAAEETIAQQARCSRRLVTYCMRWFESLGILIRTRTGGRVPGVWIEKTTNRYQIRYDRLRELLGLDDVGRKSFSDFMEEYRRFVSRGQNPTMPKRRWGWPEPREILVGIRSIIESACGKLTLKTAPEQGFCAEYSLKYSKEPLTALSCEKLPPFRPLPPNKNPLHPSSPAPFFDERKGRIKESS